MADVARLFNFVSETGGKIKSSEVDAELNQLVAAVNDLELVNMKPGPTGLAAGSFSAYRNAAYSVPNGGAVIPWDTEEWDESGWFNATNGRYTPLVGGIYRFTARVLQAIVSGTNEVVELYKNGAALKQLAVIPLSSNGPEYPASSALAQANGTTDFFEIHVTNGSGGARALTIGAGASFFQGELVGKL